MSISFHDGIIACIGHMNVTNSNALGYRLRTKHINFNMHWLYEKTYHLDINSDEIRIGLLHNKLREYISVGEVLNKEIFSFD